MENLVSVNKLAVICLSMVFAGVSRAEPFREFLFRKIEAGTFHPPDSIYGEVDRVEHPVPGSLKKSEKSDWTKLEKLYTPAALRLLGGAKTLVWTQVEFPEKLRLAPASQSSTVFANRTLFWATNAKHRVGFLPLVTVSGCHSGCYPIFFHLVVDDQGRVVDILQEPDHPLTKVGHTPITNEDLAKLISIAGKLPDALLSLDGPNDLVDQHTGVPPQTWTVLKEWTISGGAFTSYRVAQAAMNAREFVADVLNKPHGTLSRGVKLSDLYVDLLGIESAASLKQFFPTLQSTLKNSVGVEKAKISEMILDLRLWALFEGHPGAEKDLRGYFDSSDSEFLTAAQKCSFYETLLDSDRGAKLFLGLADRGAPWPTCSSPRLQWVDFFANLAAGDAQKSADFLKSKELQELPDFLATRARLEKILKAFPKEDRLLASAQVRFSGLSGTPSVEAKKTAEVRYRERLASMLPAGPRGEGTGLQKKYRIHLFFAGWCPHCLLTAKKLVGSNPSKTFYDKIDFVEIFNDRNDVTQKFCKDSGLPKDVCARARRFPSMNVQPELYERYALSSVPRAVITDKDGRIASLDVRLDDLSGDFLARDLEWLVEAADWTGGLK